MFVFFFFVFFTFKLSTQIQGRGPLARHKIKLFLFSFFLARTARVKSTWVLIVFVSLKKNKKESPASHETLIPE